MGQDRPTARSGVRNRPLIFRFLSGPHLVRLPTRKAATLTDRRPPWISTHQRRCLISFLRAFRSSSVRRWRSHCRFGSQRFTNGAFALGLGHITQRAVKRAVQSVVRIAAHRVGEGDQLIAQHQNGFVAIVDVSLVLGFYAYNLRLHLAGHLTIRHELGQRFAGQRRFGSKFSP